jgi:hypothetical protein
MVDYGWPLLTMVHHGQVWLTILTLLTILRIDEHGCLWLTMVEFGSSWLIMVDYGQLWLNMVSLWLTWVYYG